MAVRPWRLQEADPAAPPHDVRERGHGTAMRAACACVLVFCACVRACVRACACGIITTLFFASTSAPLSRSILTTSKRPSRLAMMSGVYPSCCQARETGGERARARARLRVY